VLRGTAQNPDVFFQAREAANPFHDACPGVVQEVMDELAERTGRATAWSTTHGAPDAERVVVIMGSGAGAVAETVDALVAEGERVGVRHVRLYRPFPVEALLAALPATVRAVACSTAPRSRARRRAAVPRRRGGAGRGRARERFATTMPRVIGGRYGLSSKEFTPAMVAGLRRARAPTTAREAAVHRRHRRRRHGDLSPDPDDDDLRAPTRPAGEVQAVFYGLGSDGTVGRQQEHGEDHRRGHRPARPGLLRLRLEEVRLGDRVAPALRAEPIRSTYLIDEADFVACHQFGLLERSTCSSVARSRRHVLLNAPTRPTRCGTTCRARSSSRSSTRGCACSSDRRLRRRPRGGHGRRINTVMQPCFFALAGVLPRDEAIARIKDRVEKTYGARPGRRRAQPRRHRPRARTRCTRSRSRRSPATSRARVRRRCPTTPPDFVQRVTARMIAGEGDLLPVSALPVDGTFPTGTARYEKRTLAAEIPIWDPTCASTAASAPSSARTPRSG
jgi:pyruvate-ferredoxin/flavodoxin oxidoreductase